MSDDNVAAVSLKLPTFWCKQPRTWFAQAESQFAIRGISSELTKFHYVVAAMDQETATRVLDVIEEVPAADPYTALKKRLLASFQLSEYERASALLHLPPLGDRKPSQLMDSMLGLFGQNKPDFLFRQIFLEHLPDNVRSVLVHSGVTDCRELAQSADALHEANQQAPSTQINKVSKPNKKTLSGDKDKPERKLCFYHKKWGTKAHRCLTPCSWVEPGNSQAGPQ